MESWDYTVLGLAILLFAGWCFNCFLHILAIVYGKWKLHKKLTPVTPLEELPGVTVLKPVVGVDPHLYENLETFFNMKYPQYEIIFCIQDEMDSAIMVVQSLVQKYPEVDSKIFIGGKHVGTNPKINNMAIGYEAAKYDLILVNDSGLKMKEDTLLDMVLHMREDVGLVHQIPYSCTRKGFSSHMEKIYFGTQHAKMYLTANFFNINCATGMSCLMRKNVIDEVGGLKHFAQYLAEDFFLAEMFQKKGYRLRISSHPAQQNAGTYSVPVLHKRLMRWCKLRTAMTPATIFFEPISLCFVQGCLSAWSMSFLFNFTGSVVFLVHVLVWFLMDYILVRTLEGGPLPFSKFDFLVGWMLNEITYPGVIVRSHLDPVIIWRSHTFKLKWGGVVEELHSKQTV